MKVAIIHDWLVTWAGAERVLAQLLRVYPDADLYSTVYFPDEEMAKQLQGRHINTSFIQRLPGAKKHYRNYLPLMPIAVEQFDLSGYDLVISSSHAVAKGVLTGPDQYHVCYCHSPMRYAWDLQHQYLRESGAGKLKQMVMRYLLHKLRLWDYRTSAGVDLFIANSSFIARRIDKCYRRLAQVVHPPVDTEFFCPAEGSDSVNTPGSEKYYITASRMVPYKRIDLIAQAFANMPDKKLRIIGDGPEYDKVSAIAAQADNIELLGYCTGDILRQQLRGAEAFIFAAEEDFGIAPVEAQACGIPVIAYGKGGALDSVSEESGVFFPEQSAQSLIEAVHCFELQVFSRQQCRANAERFSAQAFCHNIVEKIQQAGCS